MKQLILLPMPSALRFRRWSRKGYAAFISLQRAVTIGQLSTSVSERFQAKNLALHACVLSGSSETETENESGTNEKEESIGNGLLGGNGAAGLHGMELIRFFLFATFQAHTAGTGLPAIGTCRLFPAKSLLFIQYRT